MNCTHLFNGTATVGSPKLNGDRLGLVNQGLDAIVSRVPGGQGLEQMLNTEVDQVVNNDLNAELSKGIGGILNDVEGMFRQS